MSEDIFSEEFLQKAESISSQQRYKQRDVNLSRSQHQHHQSFVDLSKYPPLIQHQKGLPEQRSSNPFDHRSPSGTPHLAQLNYQMPLNQEQQDSDRQQRIPAPSISQSKAGSAKRTKDSSKKVNNLVDQINKMNMQPKNMGNVKSGLSGSKHDFRLQQKSSSRSSHQRQGMIPPPSQSNLHSQRSSARSSQYVNKMPSQRTGKVEGQHAQEQLQLSSAVLSRQAALKLSTQNLARQTLAKKIQGAKPGTTIDLSGSSNLQMMRQQVKQQMLSGIDRRRNTIQQDVQKEQKKH